MDKKILEEIRRMQFISEYDTSTTITEQRKGIKKALYKLNKFGDKYSPIHFEKGSKFDVDLGRTKNWIDRSWGQAGASDEIDYEDDKMWTDSGHEEAGFGDVAYWELGDPSMSNEELLKVLASEEAQQANSGMRKAMDSTSLQNWQELVTDRKSVKFVLECINLFIEKYSVDYSTPKKDLKILVGDNSFVDYAEKTTGTPAEPEDYQVPMSLPVNSTPDANFFKNNSSELEQLFISEVDGMITAIKAQMAKMKDPQVYLSYLSVLTSASRLRNTKGAIDKTWLELSKERSDAARNYVISRLDEIGVLRDKQDGVMITTEYKIDYSGKNGDGSSGPNPEKPYQYNTDGLGNWYCGDSTEKGKKCKNTRDSKGAPETIENLEKNKYLVVNIAVVFKAQKEKPIEGKPGETPEPDLITKGSYNVKFILPPKGGRFRLWLPQITIQFGRRKKMPKDTFFNNPKNWGGTKCFFKNK